MSIWKSPVFYFGILLVLAVGAALAAPFVVDWNAYRADLEGFGKKLTGREVAINGPIAVRLFPWPRLEANDVMLKDPDGGNGNLLAAELVTVRVALSGLLNGSLQVEEIELTRPIVSLKRSDTGETNLTFSPSVDLRKSGLLADVKLDKISVIDGTIKVSDAGKGFGVEFDDVSAALSAPSISGPWRAKGSLHYQGLPVGFTVASNEYKTGEDFRFGFKLSPENASWPDMSFEGALKAAGVVDGRIFVVPHAKPDGKSDAEGEFRPLTLQANISGDFDGAALSAIKIIPVDTRDGSTLIEGDAKLDFRNGLSVKSELKAPRLNLDALLGAQSLEAWRVGGVAGIMNTLMLTFPEKLQLDMTFNATVLTLAKQTLDGVSLAVEAERNSLRVKRFAANLPGQTKMLFNGIVFPGESEAELGGTLAFESLDLRNFSEWVLPSQSTNFKTYWTGNRGHLEFQTDLTLSGKRLGLQNLKYELDGLQGDGDVAYRLGQTPALDVRVNASTLDADSLTKTGISLLPHDGGISWTEIIRALVQGGSDIEKRITVQSNFLMLNGVRAQDVAIDLASGLSGLEIKMFDIGSVAGAHISAQGQILNGAAGPIGDVTAKVVADDPIGVFNLLGIVKSGTRPYWTRELGATDFSVKTLVSEGERAPRIKVIAEGDSGPFKISGSGMIDDPDQGAGAHVQVDANMATVDGGPLVRAFGLDLFSKETGQGRLSISGEGRLNDGFAGKLSLLALNSNVDFKGTAKLDASNNIAIKGAFDSASSDATLLARALGVPLRESSLGAAQLKAQVAASQDTVALTEISGTAAGNAFKGDFQVADSFTGNFELASAKLIDVAGAGLLSWSGRPMGVDTPFTASRVFGKGGEIWIRPQSLEIAPGLSATEANVGISFDENGRQLSMAGRVGAKPVSLDLSLAPKGGFYELKANGKMPYQLDGLFAGENLGPQIAGVFDAEWQVAGTGLTPFAALSDASGSGTMTIEDLQLSKIAPAAFLDLVPRVKTADDLSQAIGQFENGSGYDVGRVAMALTIAGGVVQTTPMLRELPNGALTLQMSADLPSSEISATARVNFPGTSQLPSASVVLSGAPGAVAKRSLTSELAGKLGYEILARDLAELEKVQKQQQELIAKEEQQRADDQAKFDAYQAQKAELRLRVRELKVFGAQRARDQAAAKVALEAMLVGEPAATNAELARRKRELKVLQTLRSTAGLPQGLELQPLNLPQ